MPLVLHTPMIDKVRIVERMIEIVKSVGINCSKVIFDHSTEEVVPKIISTAAVPGLTPRRDMLSYDEAIKILEELGE
jgi:predicted metal-dependent TIM-barrel fold hydrolase